MMMMINHHLDNSNLTGLVPKLSVDSMQHHHHHHRLNLRELMNFGGEWGILLMSLEQKSMPS